MANSLITNTVIAKEAIRLYRNKNAMLRNVSRQYEDTFARSGAKVGQAISIRKPVEYSLRTGPTAIVQNTVEKVIPLVVASQFGVDMSFSSVDRTMVLDRFSERYIKPAINTTVGGMATMTMANVEGGSAGWSANQDPATGAILPPVARTWLNAKAGLTNNNAPTTDFKIVMSPDTNAAAVDSLKGLFNNQNLIAKQYESGDMLRALGFDWMEDQTVLLHTTGAYATNPTYLHGMGFEATTVAGAAQSGSNLVVAAMAGPLSKGDIITVAGVQSVNGVTKQASGRVRHFTITAATPAGATLLPIYPAILGADVSNNPQAYQTVNASPANGAKVYVTAAPSSQYRKNIAFDPAAITLAVVDLEMPPNVDGAREVYDDVSIRVVTQYSVMSDQNITRLDILGGSAVLMPEWVFTVPDVP